MPTVLRVGPFRVMVLLPPREHGPAHVHVHAAGTSAVIELQTLLVRDVRGMSDAQVRDAVRIVEQQAGTLLTEWRKYHGS